MKKLLRNLIIVIISLFGIIGCSQQQISEQQIQQKTKEAQEIKIQQEEQLKIKQTFTNNRFEIIYTQRDNNNYTILIYQDMETKKKFLWVQQYGSAGGLCQLAD